tara:strand:+ start:2277 stop:2813 length:537 start_codon:yes stop_codon:yes gene_type:complete
MPITINGNGTLSGVTAGLTASSMPAGSVLQVLQDVKSDPFSTTSDTPEDVTGWSQAITMTAASNKVLVQVSCGMVSMESAGNAPEIFLVRGSTLIALGDANGNRTRVSAAVGDAHTYGVSGATITFLDTPGAGTHTYKVQMATQGGTGTAVLNKRGDDDNSASYQVSTSTLTLTEIAA